MTCPRYGVKAESQEENPGALVIPTAGQTPAGSQDVQRKWSFSTLSHLQVDDLGLEVKEVTRSSSAVRFWRRVLLAFCTSAVAAWLEQGLFCHWGRARTPCSSRGVPQPSTASAQYSPAGRFIPLPLHPLPRNQELPLLPAITLHCLACSPAKSLVSKS